MKRRRPGAWRRVGRVLRREALVLLCALLAGMGWSLSRQGSYLPSLEGNLSAILATEDALFMVLSAGDNNTLAQTDHSGNLLNYASAPAGQAFQDLEVDGDTLYAILGVSDRGEQRQWLVSLSLGDKPMGPRRLVELTGLGPPGGAAWREIYLPPEGETSPALRLVGVDSAGQGWLLRWGLETGQAETEPILEGETLFAVKYVAEGRYVWVDGDGRVGQCVNGACQRDILGGLARTPCHISTNQGRCFISDSVTGDIFEVFSDGTAALWRQGGDAIGASGFRYRQLETFTTYPDSGGSLRVTGMCARGDGGVITGETHTVSALRMGASRAGMVWRHGWRAAALLFCLLAALTEAARGIFRSPRLAARLSLCEVLVAAALLGAVTAIQYSAFRENASREARQKLRLTGGNLAVALTGDEALDSGAIGEMVAGLRREVDAVMTKAEKAYSVSVLWDTGNGPAVGYDSALPEGYLVEDVKPRAYLAAVSAILQEGGGELFNIQSELGRDYLYVQRFTQGGRTGCVAVAQSERALREGQANFFRRLLPVLAACPPLFLALVWATRRLLRPLNEIQRALEEFYAQGGGNQMPLEGVPRTELYEVGRVFNQLSAQTRTQFNTLSAINGAYARLVPGCLLKLLHKQEVTELSPGDRAAVPGGLLALVPARAASDGGELQKLARIAADQVAAHGGMLVDYDNTLGALTALFPETARASACARDTLDALERWERPVMAAVLGQRVELGVFGGQRLLLPVAVSGDMARRQAALKRLSDFGAVLVVSGAARPGLRLLGRDGDVAFYEDPAFRPASWQTGWRDARTLWEEALGQFLQGAFAPAMRGFAQVLRAMPGDGAAQWYLFRCAALRDGGENSDTGLLFDWEGQEDG